MAPPTGASGEHLLSIVRSPGAASDPGATWDKSRASSARAAATATNFSTPGVGPLVQGHLDPSLYGPSPVECLVFMGSSLNFRLPAPSSANRADLGHVP